MMIILCGHALVLLHSVMTLALYLAALHAVFAWCIGACCPLVCSKFVIYLLCWLFVVRVCLVCHYLHHVILLAMHAFLLQLL